MENKKNDSSKKNEEKINKTEINAKSQKSNKNEQKNNQNNKKVNIFKQVCNKNSSFAVLLIALIVGVVSIFSVLIGGGFNSRSTVTVEASANMVRVAQAKLSEMGYFKETIDGVLDDATKSAITQFQSNNSLVETGNLNEATLTALGVSDSEQTNSDLYLLAKLIYSEARGEIYTGQVAVGAVVLNRVEDAGFPNTLQGVIYQPWAFTALHDGQFNLEPNATAYQAAQDAMNGWDPSYGSLYYYNPATATSSWIFTRTTVVVIGNHVFAI